MNEHPIQSIMKTTLENIKEMIDVNTIVGDAVETVDGTVIIPVSRVSFGFVAGGSEFNGENEKGSNGNKSTEIPFGGGTGAGVSVNPMAFLVVSQGNIKLLTVTNSTPVDKIIQMIPQIVDDIKGVMDKRKDNSNSMQGTQM